MSFRGGVERLGCREFGGGAAELRSGRTAGGGCPHIGTVPQMVTFGSGYGEAFGVQS